MKRILFVVALAVIGLVACEKADQEVTGYSIKVLAGKSTAKTNSVTLTGGYANVTEVELENENDTVDVEIDIEGLYTFDLMTGISTPAFPTALVPAGTYHELEIEMGDESDTIVALCIEADYQDTSGTTIPITINITGEVEFEIEDTAGIQITTTQINNILVLIDLNTIIGSIDWSTATVTNNEILVDKQNNQTIYEEILEMLNEEVELDDDDSDD